MIDTQPGLTSAHSQQLVAPAVSGLLAKPANTFAQGDIHLSRPAVPCQVDLSLTAMLQVILHTGDMRWQHSMAGHPALRQLSVDLLYMDTTYAAPKHVHPPQVPGCPPHVQCSLTIRLHAYLLRN